MSDRSIKPRTNGLKEYLSLLESEKRLIRISAKVSPHLECAEIAHRLLGAECAILFENNGTSIPLAMNLYSSEALMSKVLYHSTLEEAEATISSSVDRLLGLLRQGAAPGLNALSKLGFMKNAFPVRKRGRGPAQRVVRRGDAANLFELPIITSWPHDGGPFITLPMVITRSPIDGSENIGMYRMQVIDKQRAFLHWHPHKTGAAHYRAHQQAAIPEHMPIAIALGGDPLLAYTATAPLPDGISEWLLAGFLRKKPVTLVKALTQPLWVPAEADIIIEGYVDPNAPLNQLEGPFGDHTGFYSLPDYYPILNVTAITHRRDPVYPATIVGVPPMEDAHIARATERIFLPLLQKTMAPEIKQWWLPDPGVAHNLAVVAVDQLYRANTQRVASLLWSAGQMMLNKYILMVSPTEQLRDPDYLLSAIVQNCTSPDRFLRSHGPLDALDHAAKEPLHGGKLLIDATGPCQKQEIRWAYDDGTAAATITINNRVAVAFITRPTLQQVDWQSIVLDVRDLYHITDEPNDSKQKNPLAIILIDPNSPYHNPGLLAWATLANTDPERDLTLWTNPVTEATILLLDARMKPASGPSERPWPNVVASSKETIDLVDNRWEELGIGPFIPSPSGQWTDYAIGKGAIANINK